MSTSESVLKVLRRVRSSVADYQEPQGISKSEQYSFVDLIKALFQHAYLAIVSIFTMFYNFAPLFEGFVFLLRFILDKAIDIIETEGTGEKVVKSLCFVGQLVILLILFYFIITILLIPIIHFIFMFVGKIYHALVSNK